MFERYVKQLQLDIFLFVPALKRSEVLKSIVSLPLLTLSSQNQRNCELDFTKRVTRAVTIKRERLLFCRTSFRRLDRCRQCRGQRRLPRRLYP